MPSPQYMPPDTGSSAHSKPALGKPHRRRRRRNWAPHIPRRPWSRITLAIVIAIMIPITWSIGHALTWRWLGVGADGGVGP
jgi:hypothetical protein